MESGWNVWVSLVGVVVRRYIDFLILLIPTPLVSVLFYSSIPNVFRSLQSMNELWTIIHNKMKRVKYVTAHA